MRARLLAVAGATAIAAACGGRYLQWTTHSSAPSVHGKIAIRVVDHREPQMGGEDPRAVGVQPGPFALPAPIRMDAPTDVANTVRELLGQAALAAGVGVAPVEDLGAGAQVAVEVKTFWCRGIAFHFVVEVAASVSVLDAAGGAVRVDGQPLTVEDSAGDCQTAYRKALTRAFDAATALFRQPQIQAAAVAAPN